MLKNTLIKGVFFKALSFVNYKKQVKDILEKTHSYKYNLSSLIIGDSKAIMLYLIVYN